MRGPSEQSEVAQRQFCFEEGWGGGIRKGLLFANLVVSLFCGSARLAHTCAQLACVRIFGVLALQGYH